RRGDFVDEVKRVEGTTDLIQQPRPPQRVDGRDDVDRLTVTEEPADGCVDLAVRNDRNPRRRGSRPRRPWLRPIGASPPGRTARLRGLAAGGGGRLGSGRRLQPRVPPLDVPSPKPEPDQRGTVRPGSSGRQWTTGVDCR